MVAGMLSITPVVARTLSPLHYHSLAVQSGTATLAAYLADRSMSYALANAMGGLAAGPALPTKMDYHRDLSLLPWLCTVFEAREPRLLPPIGKRLNLDTEGGNQKKIMDATGTGNLKTWFYIQEVPQDVVYDGAIIGPDPFAFASRLEGRDVDEIIVRTGRHLGGIVSLRRNPDLEEVRLNAHTAALFGAMEDWPDERRVSFALHDIQVTDPMPLAEVATEVARWRSFPEV